MRASPETGDKPRRGCASVQKALVTRSRGDAEHLSRSRIRRDNAITALEAFLPIDALQKDLELHDKIKKESEESEEATADPKRAEQTGKA